MSSANIKYDITRMSNSASLCKRCTFSKASGKITTKQVGRFLVTLRAQDRAGLFGKGGKNNWAAPKSKIVTVRDTTKPWLSVNGGAFLKLECGSTYKDSGATGLDKLDTVALGRKLFVTSTSSLKTYNVGTYKIRYNTHDFAGN